MLKEPVLARLMFIIKILELSNKKNLLWATVSSRKLFWEKNNRGLKVSQLHA